MALAEDQDAVCELGSETSPVRFLFAAHVKPRCLSAPNQEKRDLAWIAMPACAFGCDALFEAGYMTVDSTVVSRPASSRTSTVWWASGSRTWRSGRAARAV